MPKTRKIEAAEVTQTGATASGPVRRRTASATGARKAATPRTRTPKDIVPAAEETIVPAEIVIESVTESISEVILEAPAVEVAALAGPSHEQIAALAYSYWVKRGYEGGSPEQDWLHAERELRAAVAVA